MTSKCLCSECILSKEYVDAKYKVPYVTDYHLCQKHYDQMLPSFQKKMEKMYFGS